MNQQILVIGSANIDTILKTAHFPNKVKPF
jgi:hypothetical protein